VRIRVEIELDLRYHNIEGEEAEHMRQFFFAHSFTIQSACVMHRPFQTPISNTLQGVHSSSVVEKEVQTPSVGLSADLDSGESRGSHPLVGPRYYQRLTALFYARKGLIGMRSLNLDIWPFYLTTGSLRPW